MGIITRIIRRVRSNYDDDPPESARSYCALHQELKRKKGQTYIIHLTRRLRRKCVREFRNEDKLSAGLRFKGLNKVYKELIGAFVNKS